MLYMWVFGHKYVVRCVSRLIHNQHACPCKLRCDQRSTCVPVHTTCAQLRVHRPVDCTCLMYNTGMQKCTRDYTLMQTHVHPNAHVPTRTDTYAHTHACTHMHTCIRVHGNPTTEVDTNTDTYVLSYLFTGAHA